MKCFNHHALDAIGCCKNCGKGLCSTCAVDLQFALSCRGECESELAAIRAQISRTRKLLDTQRRFRLAAPVFFVVIGAVFLAADVLGHRLTWFSGSIGALFVVFGLTLYVAARRWTKK